MRKDSSKPFLEWNYQLLISNLGKTKLGHRYYDNQKNELSHDGLLVNAYRCLLSLCKAITNRNDDKWTRIEVDYFLYHPQAVHLKQDPICAKPAPKVTGTK